MSTIGGSFDETLLLKQRAMADQLMFDDRIKQQFTPQYEIINALRAAQTATIQSQFSAKARKEYDVTVMWENFCDIVAESCGTDCDLTGNKSSTNAQDYSLSFCKEVKFSMDEYDFIDNEFEINIAKALLKADKELTEEFAQYCVSQLESFRGINELTTGKGTWNAGNTDIAAAYWTPAIAAYINRVGIMNRFTNPIFLSGSLLWEQYLVSRANNANADGKGDWSLWNGLNPYFDLFNVDTVNDPDLKAYLISTGAVAMANKTWNPDMPEKLMDFTRYTMPSRFTGFKYDVWYSNTCTDGYKRLVTHNYVIKLTADLFNNPAGCSQDNTGVLSFKCA